MLTVCSSPFPLPPAELAIAFTKYGHFCPAGGDDDESREAGQRAQVRLLVQKMVEQRDEIAGRNKDESSDFDD